ncbi:hypothetical protein [Pseudomonas chlororaphis]
MRDDFQAGCPYCERLGFADEDEFFYHVSMCEWEQQQDKLQEEEA